MHLYTCLFSDRQQSSILVALTIWC